MGFNVYHWSRAFTAVTVMASHLPAILSVSHALMPALRRSTAFSFAAWLAMYLVYYLVLVEIFRKWKKQFGTLKADAPRNRLSRQDKLKWQLRSVISLSARGAAVFLGASDRAEAPWLRPSLKAMPGPSFFFRVMLFTICLDGIFYAMHRLMHTNRFLYKHVHSMHHEMHLPTAISALHDQLFEKLFNAFVQVYLASCIVPMDFWELHFACYAVFIGEIGGHTGIKAAFSPPYTPLLDFFDVGITIESHDLHHRLIKRNFGKQTVIWDKLFGTFHESIETKHDSTPFFQPAPAVASDPSAPTATVAAVDDVQKDGGAFDLPPFILALRRDSASSEASTSSSTDGDPILID